MARVEGRAPGAEDERVGGDEADFLSRGEAAHAAAEGVDEGARLPRRAGVARGRDDGHVVVGIGLERGVQLGELGVVDAVLPADLAGRAEGDDAALRGAQPQGGDRGRHRLAGAVQGGPLDQDDGERGAGSDRVDHFGVQDLLAEGEPGVHRAGEGTHHLEPRRRQVVQAVVGGEVLAQVSNHGRVRLRFGEFRQHHGLAAAVDPAPEERLDAVGDLELLRRITGRGAVCR